MLYYFYLTRNIIGLILALSPLAGLLYIDWNFALITAFFCGLLAGSPLGLYISERINFKVWTSLCVVLACAGSCLCASGAQNPPAAFLSGLAAGALALNLPASIVVSWFRASKTLVLSLVWSLSFSLGLILEILADSFFLISLLPALAGTLFLLENPVYVPECYSGIPVPPRRRPLLFSGIIGFSAALVFCIIPAAPPLDFFIMPESLFITGFITGPVITGLITDRKTVYVGSVFLIFLAEIAVASAVGGGMAVFLLYISHLAAGILISGMLVVLPVTAYYLTDCHSFSKRLSRCFSAACAGAVLAFFTAFSIPSLPNFSRIMIPLVFILLIFAFFALFSSWKRRVYLLKS